MLINALQQQSRAHHTKKKTRHTHKMRLYRTKLYTNIVLGYHPAPSKSLKAFPPCMSQHIS